MISRRAFLHHGVGAAAALSSLGALSRAMADETPPSLVIDSLTTDGPTFDPRVAVAAGLTAAVMDLRMFPRNFPNAIDALADWSNAFHRADTGFFKVLKAADLLEAKRRGKLGVILACQDASILDTSSFSVNDNNLRNLRLFYDLGLRVLQLTHNERNAVGDAFREKTDAGLSRLGERVVTEMSALGMLTDLSHCSDRTTLEAIALSPKPCAVTHAGCRALHPSLRNKPDEVIRALAEKGGYFGIYNMSVWLTERDKSSVEDVVDHIDHVVKVGGIALAGFGSDQPVLGDDTPQAEKVQGFQGYIRRNQGLPGAEPLHGHVTVQELDTPKRMEVLAGALAKRGYKGDAVEKVLGGNFARVFGAVCG
ncbi:MAG TPA: membrane dipeptidase [Thermoanaerobaculia bacterium]